ncbi:MAG: O-antigen ligase family protein [Opitutales bacterium]
MFAEDFPIPGPKNSTERALLYFLCGITILLSWAMGGEPFWAMVLSTALCIAGPVIFIFHWRSGYSTQRRPLLLYTLLMAPVWVALTAFFVGLSNPGIIELSVGRVEYLALNQTGRWLPTLSDWHAAWASTAFTVVAVAAFLPIMLLVESRWVIHRILLVLGVNAVLLAVLGYVMYFTGFDNMFGLVAERADPGFSLFLSAERWSAYALVWTGVLLGLACYDKFTIPWGQFLRWNGLLELVGAVVLGSSVYVTGSPWAIGAVSILFALTLGYLAYDHHIVEKGKLLRWPGTFALAALTIAAALGGTQVTYDAIRGDAPEPPLQVDAVQSPGASAQLDLRVVNGPSGKQSRFRGAVEMMEARPAFGWGPGSYGRVYAFFQEVDLREPYYTLASTTLAQSLAERGLVGTGSWLLMGAGILWMLTRTRNRVRWMTHFLLMALGMVAVLALVETPFATPATFFSFWVVVCLAVRWTTIEAAPRSTAGQPTRLVFTEAEMQPISETAGAKARSAAAGTPVVQD